MLFGRRRGLFGLGALSMGSGLDFQCTSNSCVPSATWLSLFQQLQAALNSAATQLSMRFTPLSTNGIIDSQTAALFDAVAGQIAPGGGVPATLHTWMAGATPQAIAQNADTITPELQRYVAHANIIPAATTPVVAVTPPSLVPTQSGQLPAPVMTVTPTPVTPDTSVTTTIPSSWISLAAIAALVLGLLGLKHH